MLQLQRLHRPRNVFRIYPMTEKISLAEIEIVGDLHQAVENYYSDDDDAIQWRQMEV